MVKNVEQVNRHCHIDTNDVKLTKRVDSCEYEKERD